MADDLFRPDSGLLCPALNPGTADAKKIATTNGFFMPDWACERMGRQPGFVKMQYQFFGRFIAYCLYQQARVDARLVPWIYKCVLSVPNDGHLDLNPADPKYCDGDFEKNNHTIEEKYLVGTKWANAVRIHFFIGCKRTSYVII